MVVAGVEIGGALGGMMHRGFQGRIYRTHADRALKIKDIYPEIVKLPHSLLIHSSVPY